MSVGVLMNYGYKHTCKVCSVISKALTIAFMATVAFAETSGRARAAKELYRQGYIKEAKALMLERDDV